MRPVETDLYKCKYTATCLQMNVLLTCKPGTYVCEFQERYLCKKQSDLWFARKKDLSFFCLRDSVDQPRNNLTKRGKDSLENISAPLRYLWPEDGKPCPWGLPVFFLSWPVKDKAKSFTAKSAGKAQPRFQLYDARKKHYYAFCNNIICLQNLELMYDLYNFFHITKLCSKH